MAFNFKKLKQSLNKGVKKEEKDEGEQLQLLQDIKLHPKVGQQVAKIHHEYRQFYNNNRNFYLHAQPGQIDTPLHLKHENFAHIRKELEVSLLPSKQQDRDKNIKKAGHVSPKKKAMRMVEKEMRFRHYSYLFRKNIKLIIKRMEGLKITVKDIFQRKLFAREPYTFGKETFEAVKTGDDAMFWRLYTAERYVIYGVDSTEKTLLIWACLRGHVAIVNMLLELGALINTTDIHGRKALSYAIQYDQAECVKRLLLWGATTTEEEMKACKCSEKVRKIIELSEMILPIISRMDLQRRTAILDDRLRYLG